MPDYLALEWDANQVCGLDANVTRGSVRVRAGFSARWPETVSPSENPQQAGAWLKEQLQQAGISSRDVLIALPREAVVVKPLDLPQVPDDELADVVRLQAATSSSVPLDQLLLDYLPLPSSMSNEGRAVLMTTFSRKMFDRVRLFAEAAGLQPVSLGISSVAVADVIVRFQQQRGIRTNGTRLIVARFGERVEMSVIQDQSLLFTHSISTSATGDQNGQRALISEINRSLVAVDQSLAGARIDDVWVLGIDGDASTLFSSLAERFSCEVTTTFDPLVETGIAATHIDIPGQRWLYAPSAGMLLSRSGTSVESVDFLNPRKPPVRTDRRKLHAGLIAGGVLLLAVAAYANLFFTKRSLDKSIEQTSKKKEKLEKEVDEGNYDLADANTIQNWAETNVNWIEQFGELKEKLGDSRKIYLTDYQVTRATRGTRAGIRATGFSQKEEDVRVLNRQFAKGSQYSVRPNAVEPSKTDAAYPFKFELNIDLVHPADGAGAEKPKKDSSKEKKEELKKEENKEDKEKDKKAAAETESKTEQTKEKTTEAAKDKTSESPAKSTAVKGDSAGK